MDLSNENIIHVKGKNVEYLQFRKLQKYSNIISHAYVLGLDKNFKTSEEENRDLAVKSYKTICDELHLDYNNIVKPNQCHTNNVEIIERKIKKNEPDFRICENTDGLITNKENIILSSTNADCILLLMFDPIKKVIANIHSGWKGTLNRISKNAIEKMKEDYGCKPENIICCICPSIRKCHFEVDYDVFEMFNNEFRDLENLNEIIEKKGQKWYIDTVLINKTILKKCGLVDENVIDSGICSVCNKDIIHSYRAEGKKYGLSTAIITIARREK